MLLILLKTDLKLRQLEYQVDVAVNLVNRKHLIKIVTSNLMIKLRMSEVTPRRGSTCIRIDDTRQELR